MKRILFIGLLAFASQAHALDRVQADSLVARGVRAYAAGDHGAARAAFDSVSVEYSSAALELNLGNCFFKLGDVAHAILHYERGLRLAPGDADLQANLDFANEQVKDRVGAPPAFALGNTWAQLRSGADPDQWARRSLWASMLFFTLLGLAVALRRPVFRRAAWAAAGVALIGLLLCLGFAWVRHSELRDDSEAIIMAPKVDVRGEPRPSATVLFVLHKGTKVTVLQQDEQGWSEVQLPNGNVGWMPPATVERI
ncbi:MAG: tetratricopeptide repeat protein [Flavobacteriales bacterium]|nr:tetratricopeptide repeat protein [Flavobacteriales bacterium]